jgi:hypothetical protein
MLTLLTPKIVLTLLAVIVFIIYWVDAFILLYHLTRFGVGTQPKRFAAVFFVGSVVLFSAAILAYGNVDFNTLAFKW